LALGVSLLVGWQGSLAAWRVVRCLALGGPCIGLHDNRLQGRRPQGRRLQGRCNRAIFIPLSACSLAVSDMLPGGDGSPGCLPGRLGIDIEPILLQMHTDMHIHTYTYVRIHTHTRNAYKQTTTTTTMIMTYALAEIFVWLVSWFAGWLVCWLASWSPG
jgi:hypothetical protein